MPEHLPSEVEREVRAHPRYCVDLKAVAVRLRNRLLPFVPANVPVSIKDISQVALRWFSKEVFYRGELVGLNLETGQEGFALRCVARVYRTRRIRGGYEVVGFFLKVAHDDPPDASSPAESTAEA